jgi:DNA ligase (NAD+)
MKRFGPRNGNACAAWLLRWMTVLIFAGAGWLGGAQPMERTASERIAELRKEIARHDDLYFRQAEPEITDAEYDRLKRELRSREAAQPDEDREPGAMGDDRNGHFPPHAHQEPMLSLDKAHSEADWRKFHAGLAGQLGRADLRFVIEPKYDGLAISLTYDGGRLVRAVTRGNGREGDEVTDNVRTIHQLPAVLRGEKAAVPDLVELRGEIYVDHAEFTRLNAVRTAAGEPPFAHPRNLAAGTLKSADPDEVKQRRLSVVIHGWGAWAGGTEPVSQQDFQAQVRSWGLPGVTQQRVARTAEEVWAAVRSLQSERRRLDFPIDGAVVKLDDAALMARVGLAKTAPRWALACKYEAERAMTRLTAITVQVGRTGVLTPVAEFEPVELGGTRVERATLHNRAEIARRDLRIGDFIEVEKAGDIIPAVVGVRIERRPAEAKPFLFPDRCPSCDSPVVMKPDEVAVYCPNTRCQAQRQRRLEHFVSAQAVAIRGFGPATIAALIEAGRLHSPADFYRLRHDELQLIPGIGEKRAELLLAGIEASKQAELWRFIHGFSIPDVGPKTARQLATLAGDLRGFTQLGGESLVETVGPAAADAVREFLAEVNHLADLREMIIAGVRPRAATVVGPTVELHGKIFVFTGTLPGLTRAQAAHRVETAGGIVRDSVSRQTDYVVAGEGAGAKLVEAQRLGVKVLTFAEFKALLGMP